MNERPVPPGSASTQQPSHSFTREMGLTHAEFFASLPPAIEHRAFSVERGRVHIALEDRSVAIELGPERARRIGSLQLPTVQVRFSFFGFSDQQRERFMQRFDLYFRRGGG